MKKQKNCENKQGEFVARPFNSLKGFQADAREPEVKKAAPLPSPAPLKEDDAVIFLRAVADVKRLEPAGPPAKENKKVAQPGRQLDEEERRVFLREV